MSYNVPDRELNPPEYPTRQVSFTVTRVYTYDVELEVQDEDDMNSQIHDIATSNDKGNFEEMVIEVDDVSPGFDDWLDYLED